MPKIQKTCVVCGKVFEVFPCNADRIFCSRPCTDKGRSIGIIGSRKRHGKECVCIICGKEFYRNPFNIKRGGGKVCSPQCAGKARSQGLIEWEHKSPPRNGKELQCIICGKTFYRKKSYIERGINKTCGSKECLSAYGRKRLGLEPLKPEDIGKVRHLVDKTTVWSRKQKNAWIGSQCAVCGSKENLELDHIIPVFMGGKSIEENAQTLCKSCHQKKSSEELRKAIEQTNLGG